MVAETILAVPSKLQSKIFQTVKMRSRAADSETRYDRKAFLIAAMAAEGLDARAVTRAVKAAFRLERKEKDQIPAHSE